MLQPRVEDQPEVDPEVGAPVEAGDGHEAELVGSCPYSSKAGDPARSPNINTTLPVRREEFGPGSEVVQRVVLDGLVVVEASSARRIRY